MVVYIYSTTAAGNSISSRQLGSSYQVNRYNVEKAGGNAHLGLPSKFPSKKILLETVFVIPQKKMLLSWNYVCLGIANSKAWNKMEFGKK
jgi:hypothetical protein